MELPTCQKRTLSQVVVQAHCPDLVAQIEDWLLELAEILSVVVYACAVMSNHLHVAENPGKIQDTHDS